MADEVYVFSKEEWVHWLRIKKKVDKMRGTGVNNSPEQITVFIPQDQASRGIGGSSGSAPALFLVKEIFPKYLRCHTLVAGTEGTADISVGKPWWLLPINATYTIRGQSIGVTHAAVTGEDSKRTSGQEHQIITVPYFVGAILRATRIPGGNAAWGVDAGSNPIEWIDDNMDGRAWAREYL